MASGAPPPLPWEIEDGNDDNNFNNPHNDNKINNHAITEATISSSPSSSSSSPHSFSLQHGINGVSSTAPSLPVYHHHTVANGDSSLAIKPPKRSRFTDAAGHHLATTFSTVNGIASTDPRSGEMMEHARQAFQLLQNASNRNNDADGTIAGNKRRSRWASKGTDETPALPQLTPEQLKTLEQQARVEAITADLKDLSEAVKRIPQRDRSPSPLPVYNSSGQRTNTRENRLRDKLQKERDVLIKELQASNPSYKPPIDYILEQKHKKGAGKIEKKYYIPTKEYPDYNFIGLVIGPRGNTQKRMERETGCKIAIRGKGAVKEGKAKIATPYDDDELHVLVIGDNEADVDRAGEMVKVLLQPTPDELNDHKNKQLRELAVINGTLREDIVCKLCGQAGHRVSQCPEKAGAAWKKADVRCNICGSSTHPTHDCPNKQVVRIDGEMNGNARHAHNISDRQLDSEYASFMADITGQPQPPPQQQQTQRHGDEDGVGNESQTYGRQRQQREHVSRTQFADENTAYREYTGRDERRHQRHDETARYRGDDRGRFSPEARGRDRDHDYHRRPPREQQHRDSTVLPKLSYEDYAKQQQHLQQEGGPQSEQHQQQPPYQPSPYSYSHSAYSHQSSTHQPTTTDSQITQNPYTQYPAAASFLAQTQPEPQPPAHQQQPATASYPPTTGEQTAPQQPPSVSSSSVLDQYTQYFQQQSTNQYPPQSQYPPSTQTPYQLPSTQQYPPSQQYPPVSNQYPPPQYPQYPPSQYPQYPPAAQYPPAQYPPPPTQQPLYPAYG